MEKKKKYPDNYLILFFLGPLFLFLIKISGKYYNGIGSSYRVEKDNKMGKKLILMTLGTLFYALIIIISSLYE